MSAPLLDNGVSRRGFLKGMAGILAASVAPAAIGSNILMPIKKLWVPELIQSVAFFNGRVWMLTNTGTVLLTVTGMDIGEESVRTPRPIDLAPGESIGFQSDAKVFSKWNAPLPMPWEEPRYLPSFVLP